MLYELVYLWSFGLARLIRSYLSVPISVPERNPLFIQPLYLKPANKRNFSIPIPGSPAYYLVLTLWAVPHELAAMVSLKMKPLVVLSLSVYLDPKNISVYYKEC